MKSFPVTVRATMPALYHKANNLELEAGHPAGRVTDNN